VSLLAARADVAPACLEALVASLLEQTYQGWELCVAAGDVSDPETRALLRRYEKNDPRIRADYRPAPPEGGANAALALAAGEYVALADADALLAPFALYEIVHAATRDPEADLIYSDEDRLSPEGARRDPLFKPDWSPDTLRSHDYVGRLAAFRRDLVTRLGGFRPEFGAAQEYDLLLRAGEEARRVAHVPKVLYHGRGDALSAEGQDDGRAALQEHLDRRGLDGYVRAGPAPGVHQACYRVRRPALVTAIIPSRDHHQDLARSLASLARSRRTPYEVIVVENQSQEADTFALYRELERQGRTRVLAWDGPFNYAAVNNFAAARARGEVLLFLNNDIEAIHDDWLERLLEHAQRPEVGAAGAKLYYPDDTVQHAGIILGLNGAAGHSHRAFPRASPGYARRLQVTQNVSALTGACLMTRRAVFEEAGGFDERFVLTYNDVDFCLRLRQRGYLLVWTPHAELYHHECTTRGYEDTPQKRAFADAEVKAFQEKWRAVLQTGDPYYNPNLTLLWEDFSLRI
jgi:GT2 family glycosyltransferase